MFSPQDSFWIPHSVWLHHHSIYGCDHKVIFNLKSCLTVWLPKLNRSLSTILRDGGSQRIIELWYHYFIVLFHASIAVLLSYRLCAFCLSQLNKAFIMAFILSGVLFIKAEIKKCVTVKDMCALCQFYFQSIIIGDTVYLSISKRTFYPSVSADEVSTMWIKL